MVVIEGDGNGWVVSASGERRWGRYGAAGLLLRAADPADPDTPLILLQHRAVWTASGDTWALPGGARDSHEDAATAALRETEEEAEIRPADVTVRSERVTSRMPGTVWHRPGLDMRHIAEMMSRLRPDQKHTDDDSGSGDGSASEAGSGAPSASEAGSGDGSASEAGSGAPSASEAGSGDGSASDASAARPKRAIPPLVQESTEPVEWTYTTVVADAPRPLETVPNNESLELRWVPETEVAEMPLMPAFAAAWAAGLRSEPVELVVDVANVLGSRPNGWWKDRAGATTRLLDELGAGMPRTLDLPAGGDAAAGPDREFGWVARAHAVIEGAARDAEHSGPFVVHRAAGSGDDAIVELVTALVTGMATEPDTELSTEQNGGPRRVVVVTADRGLRDRLPGGVVVVGPRAILT